MQDKYAGVAEPLNERSLAIGKNVLDSQHPYVAQLLNNRIRAIHWYSYVGASW